MPLIHFDVTTLQLHLLSVVLWIDQLHLLLLFLLTLTSLIIFFSLAIGRLWCGWLCPQSMVLDLVQSMLSFAEKRWKIGQIRQKVLYHGVIMLYTLVLALSASKIFWPKTLSLWQLPSSGMWFIVSLSIWGTLWLWFVITGRTFCATICPYAVLQMGFADQATLQVVYQKEREPECGKCDACVEACPMGIDIRQGYQRECLSCGSCIDACAAILAHRRRPALINFQGRMIRWKVVMAGILSLSLAVVSVILVINRPPMDFFITMRGTYHPHIGQLYYYTIRNNTGDVVRSTLSVNAPFTLSGKTETLVSPFSVKRGTVRVKKTNAAKKNYLKEVEFSMQSRHGILHRQGGKL